MTPAQVEKFAAARTRIAELQSASAKEVRRAWGQIFGKDPKESKGTPPPDLLKQIAAALQARCARAAGARVVDLNSRKKSDQAAGTPAGAGRCKSVPSAPLFPTLPAA